MANEDEVLAFTITDQDLADEMHLGFGFGRSSRKRGSQNRAIYGVWAADSDEEDADDHQVQGRASLKKGYTGPVGFVSAGIQGAQPEPASISDDEGAAESRLGPEGRTQPLDSSDEDEGSFRMRPGHRAAPSHHPAQLEAVAGQMAGLRTAQSHARQGDVRLGRGFGDWEKNTRGIGSKLLLKMGYQVGKGLGKSLQGRSDIVEAHLRRGRGAIGAYGREGGGPKATAAAAAAATVDSEEEEDRQFRQARNQWRKEASGGSRTRVKTVYKSADQILAEGQWRKIQPEAPAALNRVKVIDMTGREQRVLSGYHAISAQQLPDDEIEPDQVEFAIPELMHNMDLLVKHCEEDIIQADRKLKHHRNNVELLQKEEEKLSVLVERESNVIQSLESVLTIVEQIESLHESAQLDLVTAQALFQRMSTEFPAEYQDYGLPHIAVTVVSPLLKAEMNEWDVLAQPSRYRPLWLQWKALLNTSGGTPISSVQHEADPFYNLLWESWMIHVRLAIQKWDARNPDQLIDFLKTWTPVVHPSIMENIQNLVVLPKLQSTVESWNPMSDPIPIHAWTHPWLEVLGQRLDVVFPTIKNKLSAALTAWHPSDRSARLILLPWVDVFDSASMYAFLLKNIVPKLEKVFASFEINPSQQNMDVWEWVMDWDGFLPSPTIVNILEKIFFPTWLKVLAQWLNHNPNYTEVTRWFEGWKSELASLKDVLKHQQIWTFLGHALEMMVRAVSGGTPMSLQPGAMEAMQYLKTREMSGKPSFRPTPPPMAAPTNLTSTGSSVGASSLPSASVGFKDLVIRRCEEHNLTFAPRHGRTYQGKQIYQCGRNMLFLDNNVIFVQKKGAWVPSSLNDLMDSS
ncbi:hypothetical protein TCAL_11554 [Tigriopus californicus]|uniref:G-patch domain-containing protein n=1 Tax=Tigriopus californicus TaxID=6832 RepID=A0A553PEU6_TIGCA|nr:tuftelin-interacting protein 11-like [Tigriopus californicus]TRY76202.1 hypothetical protein TCAL_11554 [Tigriopus californicus]|eukprot:TCALIF_11554-PA protein Name:"Similar to tfip11 Tuftelin-interacting protein 11 (Xenopus laevis)" AED:0.00 eAED:0.00 QI:0/-1/0/1/-1/1/1/0/854